MMKEASSLPIETPERAHAGGNREFQPSMSFAFLSSRLSIARMIRRQPYNVNYAGEEGVCVEFEATALKQS
jgi:hypothetical protein